MNYVHPCKVSVQKFQTLTMLQAVHWLRRQEPGMLSELQVISVTVHLLQYSLLVLMRKYQSRV